MEAFLSVSAVIDGEFFRVNEGMGSEGFGMGTEVAGRNEIWGTLSPKPPGIYRFFPCSRRVSKPGGPNGPPGLLRFARLQSALGSLPSVALPSVEQMASEFLWRLFPVSISLGVCRAGNGKRWR